MYANAAFAKLLGRGSVSEILGRPLLTLRPELDCERAREGWETNQPCSYEPMCEFDRSRPDKGSVHVEASCTSFSAEGRDLLVVSLHDVSERERRRALNESINRLRAIFHSIPIGIVQCTAEGRIVESNPAIETLLGRRNVELKGRLLHDFFRDDHPDRYLELFQESDPGQTRHYQADHRYTNHQGIEGWVRVTASLVDGSHDEAVQLIAIVEEVTERKRAERQLRDAQKMEVIGRLVGGVAHDFNNLLTGIMLYSDLLAGGLNDAKLLHHAEEIRMAGEQGAALVQQLLAINRQQVVEPRILCINSRVIDTRDMLSRLIGENIELCTELASDLGNVRMDPTQLQQILLNLVLNARDAMPGGGRIVIRTSNTYLRLPAGSVPGNDVPGVMLSVIDHGCGMSPDTRSHLFEPFFTTKSAGRGNGLGLATVHDIVQAAGGSIEVDSELDTGTTFRVVFPLIPDEPQPEIPEFRYSPQAVRETILVLEDNATVRQAVCRILVECGYDVLEASSSAEAQAVADRHKGAIDLLLADLGLPGLSGRAAARKLRATYPHLKCLYMSGFETERGTPNSVSEPVVFFKKPFTGAVLLQRVREIFEAHSPALPVTKVNQR